MGQLTIGDILAMIKRLKDEGMSLKEISALPIYLGDDDELNGIHCGWALDVVDVDTEDEDVMYLVDMINENRCNIQLEKGKAILIS